MMDITDNPLHDFAMHDMEQEEKLEHLPKCEECGEPIQQDYAVYVGGCWYCDECLENNKLRIGD